jgi:hypothetical protein
MDLIMSVRTMAGAIDVDINPLGRQLFSRGLGHSLLLIIVLCHSPPPLSINRGGGKDERGDKIKKGDRVLRWKFTKRILKGSLQTFLLLAQ